MGDDDHLVSPDASSPVDQTDALLALYDTALPQVYGYLSRRCPTVTVAEDLTSETFVAAVDTVTRRRVDAVTVAWLIGIARNVLRGEARNAATRPRTADWNEAAWDRVRGVLESPDGAASARMDAESMLARLSPSERKAIECRYWKDLGGQELAEALGAPSEEAARLRVFRAIQALKRLFAADAEVTP